MRHQIPLELRQLNQWVCAGEDKLPHDPKNKLFPLASVVDPLTWGSYEQACASGAPHIGFVLSKDDPYTIIDLDDPYTIKVNGVSIPNVNKAQVEKIIKVQNNILTRFETYVEISQSGYGKHVICKGRVPRGARKDKIEVYSDSRYMITTGNIYSNKPIVEQQEMLDALFAEMANGQKAVFSPLVQIDGKLTDEEIYTRAASAADAAKFVQLWQGKWQELGIYESGSEADYALINLLCFWTKDNEQVRRMFKLSEQGKRLKDGKPRHPNNRLIDEALKKIRGQEAPSVDITELLSKAKHAKEIINKPAVSAPVVAPSNLLYPPGFIGELAQYFYDASVRPIREVALVAALGWTAGVLGRCFNYSNTGLNTYIILAARSGIGKEAIDSNITNMFTRLKLSDPRLANVNQFIGPRNFASGSAFFKTFNEQKCFVSVVGEFGKFLNILLSPRATEAMQSLQIQLLDIYHKSGKTNILKPMAYSSKENKQDFIHAPCCTIIGESEPGSLFDNVDFQQVTSGFMSRFFIVEYNGPRPPENENKDCLPTDELFAKCAYLTQLSLDMQAGNRFADVTETPEVKAMFKEFSVFCDSTFNNTENVQGSLYSRTALKAKRLAALVAASNNPSAACIDVETARWAIGFALAEADYIASKFSGAQVGNGEVRQEGDLRRILVQWFEKPVNERRKQETNELILQGNAISHEYIYQRVKVLNSFKDERTKQSTALKSLLSLLMENGVLVKVVGLKVSAYAQGEGWQRWLSV